jgi:hypothetical protein
VDTDKFRNTTSHKKGMDAAREKLAARHAAVKDGTAKGGSGHRLGPGARRAKKNAKRNKKSDQGGNMMLGDQVSEHIGRQQSDNTARGGEGQTSGKGDGNSSQSKGQADSTTLRPTRTPQTSRQPRRGRRQISDDAGNDADGDDHFVVGDDVIISAEEDGDNDLEEECDADEMEWSDDDEEEEEE